MRLRPTLFVLPFVCLFAPSCTEVTPPRIFVSRIPQGTRVSREDGQEVKLAHWELTPRAGLTRGFWVIRSEHEWRDLWPNTDTDRIPLLPTDIDFSVETLLVAAPTDREATDVRILHVVDTADAGVHIYLAQALPGDGCPPAPKDERVPVDAVRVRDDKKEFHFHVESRIDPPCEEPPEAKVACRVNGTTAPLESKVKSEPGKVIACVSQGKPGMRPTVDSTWSFQRSPRGTTAKMTFGEGGRSITFKTDAFGLYEVGQEITDDLGRRAQATAEVEILPPKDQLVVQMLWTKFQPGDDPTTFPRVELHVVGEKPPPPPPPNLPARLRPPLASQSVPWILVKGDCVAAEGATLPPWCKARFVEPTTIEELQVAAFPEYRIGVRYGDDRYQGAPVLCVRTFRGAQASEWCDDRVRSEGNWWDVARVESQTGKVPVPPPPPVQDGGAPEGGVGDGGSVATTVGVSIRDAGTADATTKAR